jgi:ABC-type glycerol-3-phosphate transport system permease component
MMNRPIRGGAAWQALTWLCLGAAALVVLFPIYWIVATSLKDIEEIFASPPVFWPSAADLDNYLKVWASSSIPRYFLNTVVVAAGAIVSILALASLAAYAVTRFDFRGKNAFLIALLVGQIIPLSALMVPLFLFWAKLGMIDTYAVLIVNYAALGTPVGVWLMVGFMKGIPRELDEAARIDGAGSLRVLVSIILPLAKPGLVSTGLSVLIWIWQELVVSMTFVISDDMKMLVTAISTAITSYGIRWGELTASGVSVILPVMAVYLVARKSLIKGMTAGALKG